MVQRTHGCLVPGWILPIAILVLGVSACGDSGDSCPGDLVKCGNQCVNTASDNAHCGACNNACMTGEYCQNSECKSCQNVCTSGEKRCAPGTTNQYQVCGPDQNNCMEWKAPQNCGAGQVCDGGVCVTSCSDECSQGERECYGSGWRECGDYDADDCLEWSEVTACGTGETCDERSATCVASCTDECPAAGDRRCIPDPQEEGYEICGDYDADECLEWGNRTLCPTGQTCDSQSGTCSSDCTDDCAEGERICDDNGYRVCGHYDADPCLDWSGITPCAAWESCNPDTGQCEVSCSDECPGQGDKRCAGDGYDTCGDYDSDPCIEWGGHTVCPPGTKCDAGQCIEDCQDECETSGARICDGDGYRICGANYDGDSCLEWSDVIPCDPDEVCSNGVCAETCTDECQEGERECFGDGWRECVVQADPACNIWSQTTACGTNEICDPDTAECVPSCTDECAAEGDKECYANGWRECGFYDADACLDWSAVNPCASGQVCDPDTAECIWDCVDECETSGDHQCAGDGYDVCGDYDADPCLEWGGHVVCPAGTSCSSGECLETCTDDCTTAGEQVCDGNGYRICGEYDTDDCLDWSGVTYCAYNEVCQDGQCVEVCTDECEVGERTCEGNGWRACGEYDGDPCLEWSSVTNCTTSQMCYRGQCIDDSPPSAVLVNEILYDDESDDGEFVFIELWGPAGLSLDNFSLAGINGANGDTYMTIELDGYSLPDDGHFVVADTTADQQLLDVADLLSEDADLQNGPDSVQVLWGGSVLVDALGYGEHDPDNDVFSGEGTPAESADYDDTLGIMYCLSRGADHADTNDNYNDFMVRTTCTPGWEGPGAVLWQAYVYGGTSTPAVDSSGAVYTVDSWGWPTRTEADGTVAYNVSLPLGVDGTSSFALSWDEATAYLGTTDGLYALDPATGDPVSGWGPVASGCAVHSSPAVDPVDAGAGLDGAVYFGTRCSTFVAANPDGTQKWSYPASGWVDSSPARLMYDTGDSYVVFGVGGVGSGAVVCLDTTDGSEAWTFATSEGCNSSPAIGSDGTVYIGCDDGMLYAFAGDTGVPRTGFPVPVTGGAATTTLVDGCSPVVAPTESSGDLIFMTSHADDGNVWVYQADGTQVLGGTLLEGNSSITLAADANWLLHTGYFLGAYTLLGNLEWYAVLDDTAYDWISSSPTIAPGAVVYVLEYKGVDATGLLYAIQGSAELYTGQGAYPKFRADWGNTGWGF